MKKFILIVGNNSYKLNTVENIIRKILSEEYYNLDESSRKELMEIKAYINYKANIISKNESFENVIDMRNEITYILSLCRLNNIFLLENVNSNVFTKNINTEELGGNYVIVNTFANKLLKNA